MLVAWITVSVFMAILWMVQKLKGEADIVDFGWTVSLGFLAVFYSCFSSSNITARALVAGFGAIWSFRLASHLWKRVRQPGEDGRYVALRAGWGSMAQLKFFIFFQAQAALAILLSSSFWIPANKESEVSLIQAFSALAWFILSITGEAISDLQLKKWRENPLNEGKTCRAGLWKYSRHPNYFFEWLYWFSYVILAFGEPCWQITLISPALMLFLILKVTGIPPTEQRALRSRGDDYRDYQRSTSAFVPWF